MQCLLAMGPHTVTSLDYAVTPWTRSRPRPATTESQYVSVWTRSRPRPATTESQYASVCERANARFTYVCVWTLGVSRLLVGPFFLGSASAGANLPLTRPHSKFHGVHRFIYYARFLTAKRVYVQDPSSKLVLQPVSNPSPLHQPSEPCPSQQPLPIRNQSIPRRTSPPKLLAPLNVYMPHATTDAAGDSLGPSPLSGVGGYAYTVYKLEYWNLSLGEFYFWIQTHHKRRPARIKNTCSDGFGL